MTGRIAGATLRVPRPVRRGLAAGFAAVMVAIVVHAGALPPPGSADAYWHFDYAFQLTRGQLPDAVGGEWIYPGEQAPPVAPDAVHYTAAHPPLLYAVSAPVLGPLFGTQSLTVITWAGRLVVMAWAAGLFAAVARLAWEFGGRLRNQATIALPVVTMLVVPVTHMSGDYYNDVVVTALTVLMFTEAGIALRDGLSTRLAWRAAVVASLGMSAKATFVLALAVALAAFVVAGLKHRDPSGRPPWWSMVRAIGLVGGLPAVVVGWFYAWNWSRSGSPVRSYAKMPVEGRPEKSLTDVLESGGFYSRFPGGWLGNLRWEVFSVTNAAIALAVLGAAVIVTVAWWWRGRAGGSHHRWLLVVLGVHVVALYVAQAWHATGYGQVYFRYFMPGVIAISAVLTIAVLSCGRRGGAVCWLVLVTGMAAAGVYDRAVYVGQRYAAPHWGEADGFAALAQLAGDAGLPMWPIVVLSAVASVLLAVTAYYVWRAADELIVADKEAAALT